jgi:hypothetical protein
MSGERNAWRETASTASIASHCGLVFGSFAFPWKLLGYLKRFGQESWCFPQPERFNKPYANHVRRHKHWRLRVSLIWQVGT